MGKNKEVDTTAKDRENSVADMEKALLEVRELAEKHGGIFIEQVKQIEEELAKEKKKWAENMTPWEVVQLSRHPERPNFHEYASTIFTDFLELRGDRRFSDDQAIAGGFARIDGKKVMLIGHNKGRNIEENIERNFGSARPDGYRKAMRLMRLAETFNVPVVTLIDTAGAYPGVEAEERGQSEAIANNLVEMAQLTIPVICIVTGEGGSGGALGIGVGNRVLMLSNATYSVISPEGCAGILWRDGKFAPDAAAALKCTAPSLIELGVVDEVIKEPLEGAHINPADTMEAVKAAILTELEALEGKSAQELKDDRFTKFSNMGIFNE